jgi:outer membrane biosynthesis protein TonB
MTSSKRFINVLFTSAVLVFAVAVVSGQNPPCYLCGGDQTATFLFPDNVIPDTNPAVTCGEIFTFALQGAFTADECTEASASVELQTFCGCSNVEAAPVASPVEVPVAPVAVPVITPEPTPPLGVSTPTPSPSVTPEPLPPTTKKCKEGKKGMTVKEKKSKTRMVIGENDSDECSEGNEKGKMKKGGKDKMKESGNDSAASENIVSNVTAPPV